MTGTADLVDAHGQRAQVCELPFRQLGGVTAFEGEACTVRCPEDNVLARQAVSEPGTGRVLVLEGGGSLRVALVGDILAGLARDNGWSGIVVHGAARDVAALRGIAVGIAALGTTPRPSHKDGAGERDVPVRFGGVTFRPGARVVADEDGIVVLD
jgi:regulator of ribonuclease activity A